MRHPSGGGRFRLHVVGLLALVMVCLSGCGRDATKEPGVVAVVAGSPIRLADVEARHDLGEIGLPAVDNPSVERLRTEYGAVLTDLIVARLVRQELARQHKSVTEAELAAAQAKIRADYPGDSFDRMLLEERIDLARWREFLGDRLALEKFTREVLRQDVRVEVAEAAAYYKEHIDTFSIAARLRLARVQSSDAAAVKAALAAYRKSGNNPENLETLSRVTVQEAVLPEKNLSPAWREALKGLKPGEATGLLTSGKDNIFCVLLARLPATVIEPAKAYARVEAFVARQKLEKAFIAWLAETMAGAKISVSKELLAMTASQEALASGPGSREEDLRPDREMAAGQTDLADAVAVARPEPPREESTPASQEAPAVADTPQPAADTPAPATAPTPAPAAAPDEATSPVRPTPPPAPAMAEQDVSAAPPASNPPTPNPPDSGASAASATASQSSSEMEPPASPTASSPQAQEQEPRPQAPDVPASPQSPTAGGGEVTFMAVKASWIRYIEDDKQEERVYIKPGKPYRITYTKKLIVRLGSPSEVRYRQGDKEKTVTVGNKESRILEFP